jgi:V/A-type H+-transporting ATPase subunit C
VIGMQVDGTNLMSALRLQRDGIDELRAKRYFLRGGHLDEERFLKLVAAPDVEGILDGLKGGPYAGALDHASLEYLETESVTVFQRALEQLLVRKTLAARRLDPLGIGVLVTYLYAKQNEVTNLRIIVMGHAVGIPDDRLRQELVLV